MHQAAGSCTACPTEAAAPAAMPREPRVRLDMHMQNNGAAYALAKISCQAPLAGLCCALALGMPVPHSSAATAKATAVRMARGAIVAARMWVQTVHYLPTSLVVR